MENQLRELLNAHVPQPSVDYCVQFFSDNPFNFKITRKRLTKSGDYRYDPRDSSHTITINGDLNPFAFLITFIHECAHLKVKKAFGNRLIKPHGKEWKSAFQELMLPLLNKETFPIDILRPLTNYMLNPKASTHSDHALSYALSKHNPEGPSTTVRDIETGKLFRYESSVFEKMETRRTKALCRNVQNGKSYLFTLHAPIEPISEENETKLKSTQEINSYAKLNDIKEGALFSFRGRPFQKKQLRRTNVLCVDQNNKREYLIHKDSVVSPL
ncbi:hypothetical protein FUAX_27840 [Fulvitalea axinellae]|uniref:SprT-like family protein n=1 Tax=Fulvitalea axinellae TaxID=1182444 RepID=A0AAU9CTJ0_9BACT|nr:hypothetical protein FUAX_27840 [Fulvitalea axinellae]